MPTLPPEFPDAGTSSESKVLPPKALPERPQESVAQKEAYLDIDYKDNQREAQKRWMAKNPNYRRLYRDSHAKYVEKNRQKQRERNRQRKPPSVGQLMIAKSDASSCEKTEKISGYYIIERVTADSSGKIAKSDASFVKLSSISETYVNVPGSIADCKEMT